MQERLIRTFVALEIPDSFKSQILAIQNELRRFKCKVSWTGISGLHLTLKFLGDTGEAAIEGISSALENIVTKFQPMNIRLGESGIFGGSKPRVLWVGIKYPAELRDLQKQIESAVANLGFPLEDREFHPHLTVGRIKDFSGMEEMVKYFKSMRIEPMEFTADKLIFFRSDLRPQGAVYTPLRMCLFNY